MSRAAASALELAPVLLPIILSLLSARPTAPSEAGAEWKAEIWQRMEDTGLGWKATTMGQGWGNDVWL